MADGQVFLDLQANADGMLRALEMVHTALEKNTNAVKKQKEELVKAEDVTKKLTTEADRAWKAIATDEEKAAEKLKQYKEYLQQGIWTQDKYTEAVKRTQKEVQHWSKQVGDDLFGNITKAGLALMAVQSVQSSITSLVKEELAARQAGGEKRIGLAKKVASLAQYEDAGELKSMARELIRTGSMTASEAFDTVEKMKAVDLKDQFQEVKKLGGSMLFGEGFDEYMGAMGSMRSGFKGKVGGVMDITSMALGAGYGAPAKASEVLGYAAKASGVLSSAGFSPEQSLAMADVASRTIGRETGSALESFGRAVARNPNLAGKSTQEIIDYVAKNNIKGEAFFKMFPDNAARVMTQFQANADELSASEARVRDYVSRRAGETAVSGAYAMNAEIAGPMAAAGREEDFRTFEQGATGARRASIEKNFWRLAANAYMEGSGYNAAVSTVSALSGGEEGLLRGLVELNNNTRETNSILSRLWQMAPQSNPSKEQ